MNERAFRYAGRHGLIKEELERGGFGRAGLFSAHMHAYLWPHMLDLMRYFFGDPLVITIQHVTRSPDALPAVRRPGPA